MWYIHVIIFVSVSKCQKKYQINECSDIYSSMSHKSAKLPVSNLIKIGLHYQETSPQQSSCVIIWEELCGLITNIDLCIDFQWCSILFYVLVLKPFIEFVCLVCYSYYIMSLVIIKIVFIYRWTTGPLSGISCFECHRMVWGVRVHSVLWRFYALLCVLSWLMHMLVHYYRY